MSSPCGRLVIAGSASGVGKTSLTLGIARAFMRRGLRVQPFKVGPDFLDPTYLSRATGRTCYNLDGWMSDQPYVEQLFDAKTVDADLTLIEGVMGLFDGADPDSNRGSTAEIAAWLEAPVLLVTAAHGMARSLAALVQGFTTFAPEVGIAGVVANRSGSERHRDWLAAALDSADLPPLVGAVPRDALEALPSRRLGLVSADAGVLPDEMIESLADVCEKHLDLDAIARLAASAAARPRYKAPAEQQPHHVRIAVAHDDAFHFCYPDNLEALARCGAEIVRFSPLHDQGIPPHVDALYIPGGYPEEHADALAANRSMIADIRHFADRGKVLYAECGGLMYLGRRIELLDGRSIPMTGVLPIATRILPKRKSLGYVAATLMEHSLWGVAGSRIRGHDFHYSEITEDNASAENWSRAYTLTRRNRGVVETAGFIRGNIMAGYPHLYWAARPEAAEFFVKQCEESA